MALLTSAAIQGYRDYTKRRIAYAKYKVGSTYYKVPIESVTTTSDGMLEIAFKIELSSGSGEVSEVQLYDTDNQLWLSKANFQIDLHRLLRGTRLPCRDHLEQ